MENICLADARDLQVNNKKINNAEENITLSYLRGLSLTLRFPLYKKRGDKRLT